MASNMPSLYVLCGQNASLQLPEYHDKKVMMESTVGNSITVTQGFAERQRAPAKKNTR